MLGYGNSMANIEFNIDLIIFGHYCNITGLLVFILVDWYPCVACKCSYKDRTKGSLMFVYPFLVCIIQIINLILLILSITNVRV